MNEEATEITLQVVQVLDKLEIRYLIAGSLASSIYGIARSTLDTDLLADIKTNHVSALQNELQEEFYITTEEIQHAINHRSSFNVIHLATSFKVDLFLPKERSFDNRQFENKCMIVIASNPDRAAYVASAEDTILAKLEWYRLGNEISERQWQDVLGIIRIQDHRLDLPYLRTQALELGVSELLEHALQGQQH
jgi:hypothetical protein